MKPLITLVISTGMHEKQSLGHDCFLSICLKLLSNQTLAKKHWRILVSDYGSGSSKVVKNAVKHYAKMPVEIIKTKGDHVWNSSICKNKGFQHVTGEFVLFLNSDNWLHPDSLKHVYSKLVVDRYRLQILVGKRYELLSLRTKDVLKNMRVQKLFKDGDKLVCCDINKQSNLQCMRSEYFNLIGKYNSSIAGHGYNDVDLLDRAKMLGFDLIPMQKPFFMLHPFHKRNDKNKAKEKKEMKKNKKMRIIITNGR